MPNIESALGPAQAMAEGLAGWKGVYSWSYCVQPLTDFSGLEMVCFLFHFKPWMQLMLQESNGARLAKFDIL